MPLTIILTLLMKKLYFTDMRIVLAFFLVFFSLRTITAEELKNPHIDVFAVSNYSEVTPTTTLKIGLLAHLEEGWHLYWKFAGDSGRPPELHWESTKDGVMISPIEWPTPEKIKVGHLSNIGLAGEVLLAQRVKLPDSFNDLTLTLNASWLVCKEECIPGSATLKLPLKRSSREIRTPFFQNFENAELLLPHSEKHLNISQERKENNVIFTITSLEAPLPRGDLIFLPDTKKQVDLNAEQRLINSGDSVFLRVPLAQTVEKERTKFTGIILSSEPDFDGKKSLYVGEQQEGFSDVMTSQASPAHSLIVTLILAFIGGFLLNLMPCVFPILSLKVLSLLKGSEEEHRQFGIFFTVGVLVSFFLLGLLFLGLKAAGATIGWGFQFQYPEFVIGISILLTVVALNLLGCFDIGYTLQSKAGNISYGGKFKGAFLSGILATVVATPCTAPFMGVAIAATLTTTFLEGIFIFLFMGCGMSFPYILFAFFPSLTRFLPKPGAWMESFKQFLAFPVLLTVVWLLDVFGKQTSSASMTALIFTLVAISFAAWIFGKAVQPQNSSSKRRSLVLLSLIVSGVAAWGMFTAPLHSTTSGNGNYVDTWGQEWLMYSNETLQKNISENDTIFLDFTAAWCITCQVNKSVIFSSSDVRNYIKENKVVLIRGDWTLMNPEITMALEQYQRAGVPLNVVIVPGKPPQVLPSVLTPALVLSALKGENSN